jgi:predicted phosphodiesterase
MGMLHSENLAINPAGLCFVNEESEGPMVNVKMVLTTASAIVLAFLLMGHNASAKTLEPGQSYKNLHPLVVVPAEKMPQSVILTWTGDPSTTQAVTWRTLDKGPASKAQIAIATSDPDVEKNAFTFDGIDQQVTLKNGNSGYYHTVELRNLKPGILYAYRVGDGELWSEWNQFRTAEEKAEPFRFIYLGDAQYDLLSLWSRLIRTAYSSAPDAKFILHVGDLVTDADSDEQWQEWFQAAGWINRVMPSILCIGNHEQPDLNKEDDNLGYSLFWRPQFALPMNGPDDLKEITYFFDYANVRFLVLNGTKYIEEQAKWLEPVLANTRQPWKIAVIHQPIFSTGKTRDNVEIRNAFEPLFDRYHVDVVLQGHDHTYGRTHKIHAGKTVGNTDNGTVYCTSVSGPKQYPWNPKFEALMARTGTNTQLYQIISVSHDKLTYDAYTADQDQYDHFVLHKSSKEAPSTLIEK